MTYIPADEYKARWDEADNPIDHELVQDHSMCVESGAWPECTEPEPPDPCPRCGAPLRMKWSGVECSSTKCSYWFCY